MNSENITSQQSKQNREITSQNCKLLKETDLVNTHLNICPRGLKKICLFVLRFYGPVNPMGSCQAQSVYLTTRYWAGLDSKRLTSIVHILSPETDNCPS